MPGDDPYFKSEKERSTSAIKRSETNLRKILDASPFPIIVSSRGKGDVIYVNKLASNLFGINPTLARGRPEPAFFCQPADRETVADILEKVGEVDDFEARLKRGDGTEFPALVSASHVDYEGESAIFLSFNDITRRKEMETELIRLATTDPLTGLNNRRSFEELAEREFKRAKRYGNALSALMLDLDWFKRINDAHGHAAGDEVLKNVARIITEALRETDLAGRIGGEEFAALLPETSTADAMEVAQRLRATIESANVGSAEAPLKITASIGVSQRQDSDKELLTLLKRADAALYTAKDAGRNRVDKG
ncbi:MAG: sensor domain-containing diguanylate cyclase [Planctomycetes bacterium]|nr:sensor domain-containing diguanylate cyclase [Planctomycetota bacterium]